MVQTLNIGIAGLGTVGAGVVKLMLAHADLHEKRTGVRLNVSAVSARDQSKDRGVDLSGAVWVDTPLDLVDRDDVDVVVELIGGSEGIARDLVRAALKNDKHVVTANKALMAHHGFELASLAEANEVALSYEAAVAGGIPAIKALREGMAANEVRAVYGILNGTCNYILSDMRVTGREFDEVLREAQEKGYAEADPSFDIDGVDAGHKICLLASIAFGVKPDFSAVSLSGIRHISSTDIETAGEMGYRIKLLGVARNYDGRINISVEPCLVPVSRPLAAVDGVYNAVFIDADYAGRGLLTGRGAGERPTASAVVADVLDLAKGKKLPAFGVPASQLAAPVFIDAGERVAGYYLRLNVLDQPGVLADVSAILRDHHISIESLVQRGRDPDQPVSVVIITHETKHADIEAACGLIESMGSAVDAPRIMRIEDEL